MGQIASDDFNRADSSSLGSNWTNQATALDLEVVSNQAHALGGDAYAFWSGAGAFTDNQYSEVTVATFVSAHDLAVGVKQSGAGVGIASVIGYFGGTTRNAGTADDRLKIWVLNADNNPVLIVQASSSSTSVASGDVLRLEVTSAGGINSLTLKKNGSTILTATDATLGAGGKPGMLVPSGTGRFDDWSGGTLDTASRPSFQPNSLRPRIFAPGVAR